MRVLGEWRTRTSGLLVLVALAMMPPLVAGETPGVVNVYSYRQPFLVQPMFDAFTRETGIGVKVVFAKKGLTERLKREGRNSPADLIFTVDIGRLNEVYVDGLTQPVSSAVLDANIPPQYHGPGDHYFGLTLRARVVAASNERAGDLKAIDYEDLALPEYKGRICTRSGKHVYMVALFASMIAHHGPRYTEQWMRGLKANLARRPQGNDRAQVRAVKEGVCDLALVNHYYIAKMYENPKQRAWAEAIHVIFPNQTHRGTHVNISGVALTAHAPHRQNAIRLMEFLSGDEAQSMYSQINSEYPVKPGVRWSEFLRSLGVFKADDLALGRIAALRTEATKLADKVGYNE